ncbi:MAG: ABC transporter ATP-binding protein [Pseudonocardia sp. SCN 72-86]|nr:MAG: ABC transporter ATP-binding protein [Pseudonocardia sp. SCN 72-86]
MLRTVGLSWQVDGVTIVDSVDLEVRRGELLSLIGPNGAGKSTLVNLISGDLRPSRGVIELAGRPVTGLPAPRRVRLGLARTFQVSSLFTALTVLENARLAAQINLGRSLSFTRWPRRDDRASRAALDALERVGLQGRVDHLAGTLSHGDKRKLEVAMALCCDPYILLLDEPAAGVSAEDLEPLADVIRELHASGMTVIMVEHHMDLVTGMSNRIAVLQTGELLVCGTPDVVIGHPAVRHAYLGIE